MWTEILLTTSGLIGGWISYPLIFRRKRIEPKQAPSFKDKIKDWEKKNNSMLIIINHISSGGGLLNFEEPPSLTFSEAKRIISRIKKNLKKDEPAEKVDLLINTPGGSLCAAEMIIHALLSSGLEVRVYVPSTAFSAGTILSLAGHEIHMDPISSFLGPVDPQINGFPAHFFDELRKRDPRERTWVSDFFEFISTNNKETVSRVEEMIEKVCTQRYVSTEEREWIMNNLLLGRQDHDHPFSFEDLSGNISRVVNGIPDEIQDIFELDSNKTKTNEGWLWKLI